MSARTNLLLGNEQLALGLISTAVVTVPLWFVTYAPLNDYPGHVARMVILRDIADGGPQSRYYEISSFLIPNVGMDAVIMLLGRALDIPIACRIFLLLTMALAVFGAGFLSRTLYGRDGFAPLLAGLVVYNQTLSWGFINYLFAIALLPWAVGIHIRLRERAAAPRFVTDLLLCLALYFAHVVGFVMYAVVVAALELVWSVTSFREKPGAAIARLGLAAVPALLMLALFALSAPTALEAGRSFVYGGPHTLLGFIKWKLAAPFRYLSVDNVPLDYLSAAAAALIAAFVAALGKPRIRIDMVMALVALGLLMWVTPTDLFSARYVDTRMPGAIMLLLAGSLELRTDTRRVRIAIGACLLALLAVRSAAVARDWVGFDAMEQEAAEALRTLPRGGILFAAVGGANPSRSFEDTWRPPIGHLSALAVVVRSIFVPAVWAHPAQQPIKVKTAYADIYDFQTPGPLEMYDTAALTKFVVDIRTLMTHRRDAGQDDFGGKVYMILLFPKALGFPAVPGTTEVSRHERFSLYRIGQP